MEALTAASVAALTIYDMCKAVDRAIEITAVRLLRKEGGKSGRWVRARAAPRAPDRHAVTLKPGRDFSVRAGHPWIFSGAIAVERRRRTAGVLVEVRAADGRVLGLGTWNPRTASPSA
jgi:hypothetical protein